eukprot:TRINITY_DN15452_c0_g1_i1.p1 TRINITY_DN15452_c0_g1~~TRINITY_DN15452_c0_g1_i1.p1  ORF type:complete len:350 (+),score=56.01 TRINITY_DN15452_c0_g1_i1:72-1052(+)
MCQPVVLVPCVVTVVWCVVSLVLVVPHAEGLPVSGYVVVKVLDHDPNAFTQGLLFHDGYLYESTGLWGRSSVRKLDAETGEVLQTHDLDRRLFGEGLAAFKNKLVQLTWTSHVGIEYTLNGDFLQETQRFRLPLREGWGLTAINDKLVATDSTNVLTWLNPRTYEVLAQTQVLADGDRPIPMVNELEAVNGEIWANVYMTDYIARIDPATSRVIGWIDLHNLLSANDRVGFRADVLNGIAYDPDTGRLWVTGKLWPKMFLIQITKPLDTMLRSENNPLDIPFGPNGPPHLQWAKRDEDVSPPTNGPGEALRPNEMEGLQHPVQDKE